MKIALFGYGKMGKTIEKIALERGHEVPLKISGDISDEELKDIDIAIDFSVPDAAFKNIAIAFRNKIPVISGTTGWLGKYQEAVSLCHQNSTAFIYASNFSLGVNIFYEINKKLSELINPVKKYEVSIEEIHHTEKLDAPSGTAISLAEQIMENSDKKGWTLEDATPEEIPIRAKRIPDIPGTHVVSYESQTDSIEIRHTAHSREGFALGAVIAAEWLKDKKGVYTMKDVLFNL